MGMAHTILQNEERRAEVKLLFGTLSNLERAIAEQSGDYDPVGREKGRLS
jgi:hypothetical protein